jgi:hypothetical protein
MKIQASGFLPSMGRTCAAPHSPSELRGGQAGPGQPNRWLYRLPVLLLLVCGVFQARGQPTAGQDALMV